MLKHLTSLSNDSPGELKFSDGVQNMHLVTWPLWKREGRGMKPTTIVEVPFESPYEINALPLDEWDPTHTSDPTVKGGSFRIRLADTHGQRSSANMLIDKMYSWRGYTPSPPIREIPNRITLVAHKNDHIIGTITLGFDSSIGLLVDELYKEEINPIRKQRRKLCEFTKLAVDGGVRSKRVLASLFHIAYIYAYNLHNSTDLFIEVNPRHAKFYEKMLGFKQYGPEKHNHRVNAPAVLLWLDLDYAHQQIQKFGGRLNLTRSEKSLYPYFFSPAEEEGISHRLELSR